MCWLGGAFQRLAGERFVLQKEGSHYTLRPSVFVFSNHPSFHTYFDMFLWPHLPPFFECGTVQGPPSGHFSPLSLPRTFRTTGAVRGIIPPRDCPSPALPPPRFSHTFYQEKGFFWGKNTQLRHLFQGHPRTPTNPPAQPASHTHTHTQHTHTHPPTHTNTLANKHTDTQPQNHHHCSRDLFLRYQMPDARCQINRSTD